MCWVCGVLGHLNSVHQCACSPCCVVCAVSLATWLLFTGVHAWCVVFRVRSPWPLGSCSPVCLLGVSCCMCGVVGHLVPVHWCARLVCCVCGGTAVGLAPAIVRTLQPIPDLFTFFPVTPIVLDLTNDSMLSNHPLPKSKNVQQTKPLPPLGNELLIRGPPIHIDERAEDGDT